MSRPESLDSISINRLRKHFGVRKDARLPVTKMVEIVHALKQQEVSTADQAKILGCSVSRLYQIASLVKEYGEQQEREQSQALPDDYKPLSDEDRELMLSFTAEGFRLFHDRYTPYKLSDLHFSWVQAFVENRLLQLNVPPRHAKSYIFSVLIPVWLIVRDRDTSILLISRSEQLSKRWVRECEAFFVANAMLIRDWGTFAPESRGEPTSYWRPGSGSLLVTGRNITGRGVNLSLLARGRMGATLGLEADVVIVDDIDDRPTAQSPTEEQKLQEYLLGEVLSRLRPSSDPRDPTKSPAGHGVVIGQRVSQTDVYGFLADLTIEHGADKGKSVWRTIRQPAILQYEDEDHPNGTEPTVLWPEVWSYEELLETKNRVGSQLWETYYQQSPESAGDTILPDSWIPRLLDLERDNYQQRPLQEDHYRTRVLSLDPSPTMYNGLVLANAIFSAGTGAWEKLEVLRVWNMKSGRDGDAARQRLFDEILFTVDNYGVTHLIVEESSYVMWLLADPDWKRHILPKVALIRSKTGINKHSESYGVQSLSLDFEQARITFPAATTEAKADTDGLIEEARLYPGGRLSDRLMALWFIKLNASKLRPHESYGFVANAAPGTFGARAAGTFKNPSTKANRFVRNATGRGNTEDERVAAFRRLHGTVESRRIARAEHRAQMAIALEQDEAKRMAAEMAATNDGVRDISTPNYEEVTT